VDAPCVPRVGDVGRVTGAALRLDGVGVRLGDVDVLAGVSLDLDARTVAVIGENGSGKSTFARLVGGLVPRSTGDLRVLGLDPARDARELRRRVALVFSNPDAQIVMPTVREDVAFSLRSERLGRDATAARVADALARFGLVDLADRPSHDLSGGQKQLLALAGVEVRFEDGHRLVLVTHDLAAARRCDAAVLFAGGRLARVGTPAEVVAEYEALLG
jgi:biotin transport system ATP-binding protein